MSVTLGTRLRWYREAPAAGGNDPDRLETAGDTSVDFLQISKPLDVALDGLAGIEKDRSSRWRWGLGPRTTLRFSLARPQDLVLRLRFDSPFVGQTTTVTHNGAVLHELEASANNHDIVIRGTKQNIISLEYRHWDKPPKRFPQDPRPVAARFSCLTVASTDGAPLSFPCDEAVSFPHIGSPEENAELARRDTRRVERLFAVCLRWSRWP